MLLLLLQVVIVGVDFVALAATEQLAAAEGAAAGLLLRLAVAVEIPLQGNLVRLLGGDCWCGVAAAASRRRTAIGNSGGGH